MSTFLNRTVPFDLRFRAAAFLFSAAAIYAVALTLVDLLGVRDDAALIAAGVTLDLALVVPVLYWLLVVRGGGPRLSIVPVTLISMAAAGAIVPAQHHRTLSLLEGAALPLEVGLIGFLIWHVQHAVRLEKARFAGATAKIDVVEKLSSLAARLFGPGRGGKVLAFEATVLYFALATWAQQPPAALVGEIQITHHKKALYKTFFIGVMIAGVAEIVPVHFLLTRWSHLAAWILSAFSIYGLLWLIGDYQAIRLRPSVIRDGTLQLRLGLRWLIDIPLEQIQDLHKLSAKEQFELRQEKGVLSATLLGAPRYLLQLQEPVEARGVYGLIRRVERIALTVDDERAFEAALAARSAGHLDC